MDKILKDIFINEESTLAVRNFTIVQLIFIIGLTFMTGIVSYCINDPFYTYLTVIFVFLFIATLIDANRTKRHRQCAVFMSLAINLVYFPLCYIGFNRIMIVVPMYFILGLLYTGLLVEGKLGFLISIIEIVFMSVVVVVFGRNVQKTEPGNETAIEIVAIIVAMVIVGALCAAAIKYRVSLYTNEQEKLENKHLEVIDAYNQKDIFLANTSHEIRTPLNAIVGTVNLLLDEDLDNHVRDNVYNILNSCNALLSITDELMDLSNTEEKTLDIIKSKYDFNELLTNIINMISVRLIETEIDFVVDIDREIPRYLMGDPVKIRQLFINILNNAVKYTKQGHIILRVKGDKIDKGHEEIRVDVEDTGIGIKPENISKLFEFYKRDEEDNEKRDIEGNGVGLNLCKEIIGKMGGDITVKSEYHVGSTFSFFYPQQIDSFEPIIRLRNSEGVKVLIFERNEELAANLKKIISYIGLPSEIAVNRMEFETYVLSEQFNHIFIALERYNENKRFIDRKIRDERVILVSDIAQTVNTTGNVYLVTRPLYIINIIMALNNENNLYGHEIIKKGGFTLPRTNILVVDDNSTNLEVARGILKKYGANIITALSGKECINIVSTQIIDIIFLDYMMPEMNGIDTLYHIKNIDDANVKKIPVIALTANVVNGAREMFMEAGFDDYIAKPIDINKMEKVLKNLLPREQIVVKHNSNEI